jgi:hypothetical protein
VVDVIFLVSIAIALWRRTRPPLGMVAMTLGRPPVSPDLPAVVSWPFGASPRRGPYSLDRPFPPCILPKHNQGRDQE